MWLKIENSDRLINAVSRADHVPSERVILTIGTWNTTTIVEPPDLASREGISVDWKGGGFDRFPLGAIGTTVAGRNKTGGVERDSKVVQQ